MPPGKVLLTRRGVAGQGLSGPAKTACGFVRRVASLGVPIGIRMIAGKREVCADFIPKITPSVVCGWYDGRSEGSACSSGVVAKKKRFVLAAKTL